MPVFFRIPKQLLTLETNVSVWTVFTCGCVRIVDCGECSKVQ